MSHRLIWAAGVASLALLAGCEKDAGEKAGAADAPAAAAVSEAASAAELAAVTPQLRAEAQELAGKLLDEAARTMAMDNFLPVAGQADVLTPMGHGRSHDWTVNLTAGKTYRIVGVCDFDCGDVNMELRDASGAVVSSDLLDDDVPIVEVSPTADGAYTARFIMTNCTAAPCFASARMFQRG